MSSKTKKLSGLPVATSLSDNDSLVMVTESGQTKLVEATTLNGYLGAPMLFRFTVPAYQKMVFNLKSYEYHSFTASGSTGSLQASGYIIGYNEGTARWFFNAKRKIETDVKAYIGKTRYNTFVLENCTQTPLQVRFVASAVITAETYAESTHGELAELTWQ